MKRILKNILDITYKKKSKYQMHFSKLRDFSIINIKARWESADCSSIDYRNTIRATAISTARVVKCGMRCRHCKIFCSGRSLWLSSYISLYFLCSYLMWFKTIWKRMIHLNFYWIYLCNENFLWISNILYKKILQNYYIFGIIIVFLIFWFQKNC